MSTNSKTAELIEILPGPDVIVAGNGVEGFSGDGGSAIDAELANPNGVVVDKDGVIYFADTTNQRVRKIDLLGIITTVAGTGTAGYSGDSGLATSAKLNFPTGVAVDKDGNVYIGDTINNRIRKITVSTGIITTYAGTGANGYTGDGGAATSATLYAPSSIYMDQYDNLFIADTNNSVIRKVTKSTGVISTVAGTGTSGFTGDGGSATVARLNFPKGIYVDILGALYIADTNNHRVRFVSTAGTITTVAGNGTPGFSGDKGSAVSAQLNAPEGVSASNEGMIYISDTLNDRVRKVSVIGIIDTLTNNSVSSGIFKVNDFTLYLASRGTDEILRVSFVADTATDRRWSAVAFFDKYIVAARDNTPSYYRTALLYMLPVPGLPTESTYEAVSSFANHVILWKDDVLTWSDLNDFSMYIPVGATASSLVLTLLNPFFQPAVGVESSFIYVKENTTGLTVGQFLRTIDNTVFNYYEVTEVTPIGNVTVRLINFDQTITDTSETNLYTQTYAQFTVGSHITIQGSSVPLQVTKNSINESFTAKTSGSFTVPAIGGSVTVNLTSSPGFTLNEYVSLNTGSQIVGSDVYQVTDRDTVANTLTVKRMGSGFQQQSTGSTYATGTSIISQPFVAVEAVDASDLPFTLDQNGLLTDMFGFKVKSLDLTGRSPTGTKFVKDRQIFTVDANEAGEATNSGVNINGPILNFVTLRDRGYILKEKSIQSVQYIGRDAGVFAFFTEVSGEGLYGRYTFVKIGEDMIIFLGQREMYMYQGGQALQPIARQFTRQLFTDIDKSRADEIVMYHEETHNEIFLVYFDNSGVQKQFIYNYVESSCTEDIYPDTFGNITAMNSLDWREDLAWEDMLAAWNVTAEGWEEYDGVGMRARIPVFALHGRTPDPLKAETVQYPLIVEQGGVFNYDGDAYQSLCETPDFDFGDSARFKYSDGVQMILQVKQHLDPRPFRLYVQIGGRTSLDADIRWTDPTYVEVSGNGMFNPIAPARIEGRFLRVRFYSNQADIQWRISSYDIFARMGNTY